MPQIKAKNRGYQRWIGVQMTVRAALSSLHAHRRDVLSSCRQSRTTKSASHDSARPPSHRACPVCDIVLESFARPNLVVYRLTVQLSIRSLKD
jgi:hypothetical protein